MIAPYSHYFLSQGGLWDALLPLQSSCQKKQVYYDQYHSIYSPKKNTHTDLSAQGRYA